jgi:hypothetical protein
MFRRSSTQRAFALGLVALFHVAIFSDVAMLLCPPIGGVPAVAEGSQASEQHPAAAHAGHAGHATQHHVSPGPEDGDEDLPAGHDHGSCNFCCPHGRVDVGSVPALPPHEGLLTHAVASVPSVGVHPSPTPSPHTLPNPPPVA